MHDTANRRDQIARVFEPTVRVVEDAAFSIPRDPLPVDESFERGAPVDLILVGLRRDSSNPKMIVEGKDRSVVVREPHLLLADAAMKESRSAFEILVPGA